MNRINKILILPAILITFISCKHDNNEKALQGLVKKEIAVQQKVDSPALGLKIHSQIPCTIMATNVVSPNVIISSQTDSVIFSDIDIAYRIENLKSELYKVQDVQFSNCISAESEVKEITIAFFSIIESVNINDTVIVGKLLEMQNLVELLEPYLINAENSCPELYNEYMEFLEEFTDKHYEKMQLIYALE